jgi:hypothetical protein
MWKYAILTHLRRALKAGVLQSDFDAQELRTVDDSIRTPLVD